MTYFIYISFTAGFGHRSASSTVKIKHYT